MNSVYEQDIIELPEINEDVVLDIEELVSENLVDGKSGFDIIQIYGSKENYLRAVEESSANLEYNRELIEEKDYVSGSKAAQVIDSVYGMRISYLIGKSICSYYGLD